MRAPRTTLTVLAATLVSATLVGAAGPAAATTRGDWATWPTTLEGSAGDHATTVTLPGVGGPTATVTSDSGGPAALVSGASTWLSPSTPPGSAYGSSRDRAYLDLRPAADDAGSPSTTTYDFDAPTPAGWGLVLGDIDADRVVVTGTRAADGEAATGAQLGLEGAFDYCDSASPRPPTCSGTTTSDQATATVGATAVAVVGNAGVRDTVGAAAWLRPAVPLTSVTVTHHWRSGRPVYQTWLAGITREVSGTLTGPTACDPTTGQVALVDDGGAVLATTRPAADGAWSFDRVSPRAGLRARLVDRPDGCRLPTGAPGSLPLDLRTGDATGAGFVVEEAVGAVDVTATLLDTDDLVVPGAVVELVGPGGEQERATTGDDGRLRVDDVAPGAWRAELQPLDGYLVVDGTAALTVPADGGDLGPLELEVAHLEDVDGLAVDADDLDRTVAGVTLTLTDEAGDVVGEATSGTDGRLLVEDVLPGDHTYAVTPPDGYEVEGATSGPWTVERGGEELLEVEVRRLPTDPTDRTGPTGPTGGRGGPSAPGGSAVGGPVPVSTVVTSTAGTPVSTTVTTLPATGGPAAALPWLGLLLLVGGGAAVTAARRWPQGAAR